MPAFYQLAKGFSSLGQKYCWQSYLTLSPCNSPDSSPDKYAADHSLLPAIYVRGDPVRLREESERKDIRKREHISLMKSLTMVLISTASMGKFDLKLKKEPEAPRARPLRTRNQTRLSLSLKRIESRKRTAISRCLRWYKRNKILLWAAKSMATWWVESKKLKDLPLSCSGKENRLEKRTLRLCVC